jgi:elongation factor 1 alpha-like protein
MISGATQADAALLVVDASSNSFESGFGESGQTREHAILVRSLGVQQLVVAVNKLDTVGWQEGRFNTICEQLKPFLTQVGFNASKIAFVPCAAFSGENVASQKSDALTVWYRGPTLLEQLGGFLLGVQTVIKQRRQTRLMCRNERCMLLYDFRWPTSSGVKALDLLV